MSGMRNILACLDRADQIDVHEGKLAYIRYKAICARISSHFNYPLDQVVAVFAALSPNNDYKGNLRSAWSVIEAHKAGVPVDRIKVSTYNHCRDRAFTYLDGVSFLETVKGKKIRNFYQCIMDPLSADHVTIDGHAVNIWRGVVMPLKQVVKDGGFKYEEIAADFKACAALRGMLPNQVQSITWFAHKRIHRILYKAPQLHLFFDKTGDFWEVLSTLHEVQSYK